MGVADNDIYEFLKTLNESGALENTILIVMADHGHRFAEIRNTIQGKQEERLPFFSFSFPQTFKTHFKAAYENFKDNINTLTTPFDIYTTLKNILDLTEVGEADISERSVSLFSKVGKDTRANLFLQFNFFICIDAHFPDPEQAQLRRRLHRTPLVRMFGLDRGIKD